MKSKPLVTNFFDNFLEKNGEVSNSVTYLTFATDYLYTDAIRELGT